MENSITRFLFYSMIIYGTLVSTQHYSTNSVSYRVYMCIWVFSNPNLHLFH